MDTETARLGDFVTAQLCTRKGRPMADTRQGVFISRLTPEIGVLWCESGRIEIVRTVGMVAVERLLPGTDAWVAEVRRRCDFAPTPAEKGGAG